MSVAALVGVALLVAPLRLAHANTPSAGVYGGSSSSTTVFIVVPLLTTAGIAGLIYYLVIKSDETAAPPPNPSPVGAAPPQAPPAPPPSAPSAPPLAPTPPPPGAPGAMLYLRDLGPGVATDLAVGHGATLIELAEALSIPRAHRQRFERAVRARRAALLALLDPSRLTEERSAQFFREVVRAAQCDGALAEDLASWRARMAEAHAG